MRYSLRAGLQKTATVSSSHHSVLDGRQETSSYSSRLLITARFQDDGRIYPEMEYHNSDSLAGAVKMQAASFTARAIRTMSKCKTIKVHYKVVQTEWRSRSTNS
jgi:hypothetical protein